MNHRFHRPETPGQQQQHESQAKGGTAALN